MDQEKVVFMSYRIYGLLFIPLYLIYIIGIELFHVTFSLTSLALILFPFIPLLFFQIAIWVKGFKRMPGLLFIFGSVLLIFCLYQIGVHEQQSIFSTEKWLENPEERKYMVSDLLDEYELVGLSTKEARELLGKPTVVGSFEGQNNIAYVLGPPRGVFSFENEWLVLRFDYSRTIIDYEIRTD